MDAPIHVGRDGTLSVDEIPMDRLVAHGERERRLMTPRQWTGGCRERTAAVGAGRSHMSCTSENCRVFHEPNSFVLNFRFFFICSCTSGSGGEDD